MQLVVPSAVKKAVRAATITFTATSINRFFFIIFPFSLTKFISLTEVKATLSITHFSFSFLISNFSLLI